MKYKAVPDDVKRDMLDGYINTITDRDIYDENDIEIRRPEALKSWLRAYAAAEGTTASYESIMGAATPGQDKKPSKPTTMVYREALDALWILGPVLPWLPEGNIFNNLESHQNTILLTQHSQHVSLILLKKAFCVVMKFPPGVSSDDVKQLNWLGKALPDRTVVKVIIYTGQYLARREEDGVILVPAACLGV